MRGAGSFVCQGDFFVLTRLWRWRELICIGPCPDAFERRIAQVAIIDRQRLSVGSVRGIEQPGSIHSARFIPPDSFRHARAEQSEQRAMTGGCGTASGAWRHLAARTTARRCRLGPDDNRLAEGIVQPFGSGEAGFTQKLAQPCYTGRVTARAPCLRSHDPG